MCIALNMTEHIIYYVLTEQASVAYNYIWYNIVSIK